MLRYMETSNYWNSKADEMEDKIMKRNKDKRCASCNVQTPFLMDYSIPEDPDFVMKVCGCCLNRYQELDTWRI